MQTKPKKHQTTNQQKNPLTWRSGVNVGSRHTQTGSWGRVLARDVSSGQGHEGKANNCREHGGGSEIWTHNV